MIRFLRNLLRRRRCPMCSHLRRSSPAGTCVVCGAMWGTPDYLTTPPAENKS